MTLSTTQTHAWLLALGGLLLFGGCATTDFPTDGEARTATDVPDHFLVGTPGGTATTEPDGGEACRNPMVDPRTGTRLRLVRSLRDRGDYEVPNALYGVGRKELLRLDCTTGRAVGIVPQ